MSEQNPGADRNFLNEILRNEPSLYDLHTHLLGMGDSDFWLYSVLGNERLLPTNKKICDSIDFRQKYGPLMWDDTKSKFINPECTDEFIRILINSNGVCDHLLSSLSEKETFRKLFKTIPFTELKHHNLTFLKDFSYDVILKLDNLAKAFGIFERNTHRDLLQTIVEEKLGFHDYKLRNSNTINNEFKYYIVFNARKQLFEIVYGIPVEIVRELVGGDVSDDKIQDKVILNARGYIRNAFSMRNADGTAPRMIDFSLFQGTFTPEFYPRRFALKDALYEQRLDILAYLLKHVLGRYISCAPPVKYCELSIGVGDLSRPWVFDILRSFSISDSIETNNRDSKNSSMINSVPRGIQKSTFKQLIGKYFQHLAPGSNDCFQDVTYKFLAGFSRHQVQLPYINSQAEAISLLYGAPQLCIHLMTKEMKREYEGGGIEGIFQIFVDQLNKMKQVAERHEETFYHWVVGLDLFGDESGYPYCPFVAHEFLAYIIHCRSINYYFGIRIHGGENVSVVNANLPGYRLFVAHMYIFFQSLQYLQKKLGCGIRIGHGIAFELILGDNGSITRERKSSVLLSEMQKLGKDVLKQITFEVNLTSNIYLLGTSVRQPLVQQKSHNLEILFNANIPVILATDDDGIWPINACPFGHNKHSSLPAEYCQAIDNKLIASTDQLKKMFSDTKSSAFWQPNHKFTPPPANNDAASFRPSFIVLHLDIVRHILRNFDFNTNSDQCYRFARYYEFIQQIQSPTDYGRDKEWEDQCESLSRTAFAAWYVVHSPDTKDDYSKEFKLIFSKTESSDRLYNICDDIYKSLMAQDKTKSSAIKIFYLKDRRRTVFISEKQSLPIISSSPMELLQYIRGNISTNDKFIIVDFCGHLDERETIKELEKVLESETKFHVSLRSNINKTDYIDYSTIQNCVTINQHPQTRTNCAGQPEKHVLYAVCPHGSAATAAFHYLPSILDDIVEFPEYPSSAIENQVETAQFITPVMRMRPMRMQQFIRPDIFTGASNSLASQMCSLSPIFGYLHSLSHSHYIPSVYTFFDCNRFFLRGYSERWYLRKKRENIAVNPQHTLFLDDALYAELSWAALYKKFHQTATDLISQMFELGFKSLKKYHLFPSMYAVLRSTSNRKKVKEYFDTNSDELAVPIQGMVVDYNHHLLVCTQLEALDIQFLLSLTRRKELNIGNWTHTFSDSNKPTHFRFLSILDDDELPKELSFRVAYLLWMIICEEDPFKEKHILSLVNEIVGYFAKKFKQLERYFNVHENNVWGYFVLLTIYKAAQTNWTYITIDDYCDFIETTFFSYTRILKFCDFLKRNKLSDGYKEMINDSETGKLGNEIQKTNIYRRKAGETQKQNLSKI